MQADQNTIRRWPILLAASITMGCVTLLAIGINELELKPGQPLVVGGLQGDSAAGLFSQIRAPAALMSLFASVLRIGVLLLLPFAVVHFLRSAEARKRVLAQLAYLIVFALAVLSLSRSFKPQSVLKPPLPAAGINTPADGISGLDLAPDAPRWLVTTFSLLTATAIAFGGYQLVRRSRKPTTPPVLAQEAQLALSEIEAGTDLENVILRAYYQLCLVTRNRRGLRRAAYQTAREYGADLQQNGMPPESLRELTRLFEKARYGSQPLDKQDELAAINALRAILRSLGEL